VLQIAVTVAAFGVTTLRDYAVVVSNYRDLQGALESRPAEMHSLAAITNHLPGFLGPVIWALGAIVIVTSAVRAWRAPAPTSLRMACLVLASLLVNPHVNSYDVMVLALPLVWCAAWVYGPSGDPRLRATFAVLVYTVYLTLLVPTARLVLGFQASVLVMAVLFMFMIRAAAQPTVAVSLSTIEPEMPARMRGPVSS
jgi:hypothetical protein